MYKGSPVNYTVYEFFFREQYFVELLVFGSSLGVLGPFNRCPEENEPTYIKFIGS